MQVMSEQFISAMKKLPYIARITLDDSDIIQGNPIKTITFTGGSNSDSSTVTIGCAVASSVEVTLDKKEVSFPLEGREMTISLGIVIDGEIEWISMAGFKVTAPTENDGVITVKGENALSSQFNSTYEDVDTFSFTSDEGVSSIAFLEFICQRRGVSVDTDGLEDIRLHHHSPTGRTEREIIGMLAGLYGKFATIDRSGILRFKWYSAVDMKVTADDYYGDGMEKAGFDFTVGWLKCYNETMVETLVEGDPDAKQGIYFECPWMSEERLAAIWKRLQGFSYRPVSNLEFLGDPRLDPGDIIELEDMDGTVTSLPIMNIRHEFDGGLITKVAAEGQTETETYQGPVERAFKQTTAKILKKQNAIEMSVEALSAKVSENTEIVEKKVSEFELTADAITAEVSQTTQEMEAIKESMTVIEQTAGSVEIRVSDIEKNGATKVKTEMGYTFDDQGLGIAKDGDEIKNLVDNKGLKVTRGEDAVFSAGADGVIAPDVKITNFLEIGNLIIENYTSFSGEQRTAFRWN